MKQGRNYGMQPYQIYQGGPMPMQPYPNMMGVPMQSGMPYGQSNYPQMTMPTKSQHHSHPQEIQLINQRLDNIEQRLNNLEGNKGMQKPKPYSGSFTDTNYQMI